MTATAQRICGRCERPHWRPEGDATLCLSCDPATGSVPPSSNGASPPAVTVPRPKLRVLDVEEMLRTEPPPVPWIAEPLLVRGAVTMLAGREGQGKSMLALAVSAAVGHGATVAGIDCEPGKVLVIDAENGEREAHRRLRGLGVKPGTLVYAEADGFSLARDLALVDHLMAEHRPDVLVLDSFRSLAPGMDENDSGPVEAVLGPLRGLARRRSCAVLVLHHAGKGIAGDSYRGSTAIGAAVELGFTLARLAEDPEARTRRKLTCWKCRPAPEPEPLWITLEAREGCVFIGEAEPCSVDARPPSREQALAAAFAAAVSERGALSWASLCSAAGVDPAHGTAKRARDQAVAAGTLQKLEHGRYGPATVQVGPTAGPMARQTSVRPEPLGPMDGRTIGDTA